MKRLQELAILSILVLIWPLAAAADSDEKEEKKSTTKEENHSGPTFAFVCINDKKLASEQAWRKSLKKWLKLKSDDEIKEFEVEADEKRGKKASSISFTVDKNSFVIGMMGAPVPKGDIDYACMNSFLWPEAAEVMSKHKSHMIVMALGEYESACAKSLALSRVIAAATECHDTAGVYWGHAAVVHSPKAFRKMISEAGVTMETVPTMAWVGFLNEAGEEKGTVNFYTRGLSEFGAKEIQIMNSKKKPSEIVSFLGGLSSYLLVKGDVIKDGNTVGGTEKEKIETNWTDSHIGLDGKVIQIEF